MRSVGTIYDALWTYGIAPARETIVADKLVTMCVARCLVLGSKWGRRNGISLSHVVEVSQHWGRLILKSTICCVIVVWVHNLWLVLLLISWLGDHYLKGVNLLFETPRPIDLSVHIDSHCTWLCFFPWKLLIICDWTFRSVQSHFLDPKLSPIGKSHKQPSSKEINNRQLTYRERVLLSLFLLVQIFRSAWETQVVLTGQNEHVVRVVLAFGANHLIPYELHYF